RLARHSFPTRGSSDLREALEELCRKYWFPLYAFLRRQGRSPEDAKDLTQGFLAQFLAKDRLRRAEPAKGKFRSFLLASLTNFVQIGRAHGLNSSHVAI